MTGQKMRNQSGESKKGMVCGICEYKGRRDNLKKQHFPKKNPGKLYSEKKMINAYLLPKGLSLESRASKESYKNFLRYKESYTFYLHWQLSGVRFPDPAGVKWTLSV